MTTKWLMAFLAIVGITALPAAAQAFECPKHFAKAEAAIAEAQGSMNDMKGKMSDEAMARVRTHVNAAEMTLAEAKFHHNRGGGDLHHALSIMRAHMAVGHAAAASALHRSMMSN